VAVALVCWLISYTLKLSYGWIVTVGVCILMTAYTLGGVWQFNQLKQLLRHGTDISPQVSGENPLNEERTL
jgi:hypothetical protein